MRWRSGLISSLWLMFVGQAFAAGLGDIEVQSWLGERLQARVPLLGLSDNDTDRVRVQLASVRHYHQAGLDFPAVLHGVEFSLEQGALLITTAQRVNEPIVELLLLVNTPEGEVRRQFTLLMDLPPAYGSNDIASSRATPLSGDKPLQMPPTPATAVASALSPPSKGGAPTSFVTTQEAAEPATASAPRLNGDRYGPVRRHESLWSIAQQLQPQLQLPLATIMAGLYNANRTAFVARNPNQLMEGSRLMVPSRWPDASLVSSIATTSTTASTTESTVNRAPERAAVETMPVTAIASFTQRQNNQIDSVLPVTELTEQNRQLRGEIAQLTLRLTELEARLSQQQQATTTTVVSESVAAPIITTNDTLQTGVLKPLPAAKEITLPSVAPIKPMATPAVITPHGQNTGLMWVSLGAVLITLIGAATWWWHRRQAVHKPSLNDSEWQERKRAAREAHQTERSIPISGEWRHQEATPEPPNAAESMEIKLQYVRSAVDTFLLFQRYGEALAFIRREIFEAGHDSPLGHRLDALYRETKTHLQSLGIEESVPSGEPKIEVASQRPVNDDHPVVTPLRKARPPARRDLL